MVEERRRYKRSELALPVEVWKVEAPGEKVFEEALTTNVSRGGLYFRGRPLKELVPEEMVNISVSVPSKVRREFPFSRLVGRARILRVDEIHLAKGKPPVERGVAVEFESEFVFLSAAWA